MNVVAVIPARLHSTRLPGKLLLAETGKPLIQHTWEAVCRAKSVSEVIIATDSDEIIDVSRKFGACVCLTGPHNCGADRVAEVVRRLNSSMDVVLNVQGDEPLIDPCHIDGLVSAMAESPLWDIGTVGTAFTDISQFVAPSNVKVVASPSGRVLFFSRAPIPHFRDMHATTADLEQCRSLLHLGLYAYRPEFLLRFSATPPSSLENAEMLEQLRALELDAYIGVIKVNHSGIGVDTREDYDSFTKRVRVGTTSVPQLSSRKV